MEDRWYGKDGPQKWKETKPRAAPRCVYVYLRMHPPSPSSSRIYRKYMTRGPHTGCVCFMPRRYSVFLPLPLTLFLSLLCSSARVFYPVSRMIYDTRSARIPAALVQGRQVGRQLATTHADTIECEPGVPRSRLCKLRFSATADAGATREGPLQRISGTISGLFSPQNKSIFRFPGLGSPS